MCTGGGGCEVDGGGYAQRWKIFTDKLSETEVPQERYTPYRVRVGHLMTCVIFCVGRVW